MSYARKQLIKWLEKIDIKADSVIDIGGISWAVEGKTKTWDVRDYKILDWKSERKERVTDYVYDLNKPIEDKLPQFDVAFCLGTMYAIYDPITVLRNINSVLKSGGTLYINFYFFYPINKGVDCLRYTKMGVKTLLKETGFEIKNCVPMLSVEPERLREWQKLQTKKVFWGKPDRHPDETGWFVKATKL